jgi:hypothetical protein
MGSSASLGRPYRRGPSTPRVSGSDRPTHPAPSAMSTTSMVPSWDGSWPKNRERSYGTSRASSDSRRTRAKQTTAPSIIERGSKNVAQNRPARAVFSSPPLADSRAEEEKKALPPLDPKWVPRKRMDLGLPPRAANQRPATAPIGRCEGRWPDQWQETRSSNVANFRSTRCERDA